MDRTPQQGADDLNALLASAVNVVNGTIATAVNPGSSVTFRYTNPISGESLTATGIALTPCTPARVTALRTAAGEWFVLGSNVARLVKETVLTDRHARSVPETGGKIKILFSKVVGSERVFYVGGDREQPKEILRLPSTANAGSAALTNTGNGANNWIASIAWSDAGATDLEPLTHVANIKPIGKVELEASRSNSYLTAFGYGFWSSRLIAARSFSLEPFLVSTYGDDSRVRVDVNAASSPGTGICGTGRTSDDLYTLITPTVLSGSVVVHATDTFELIAGTCSRTSSRLDISGSSTTKSFAFWQTRLETTTGSTSWSGTTSSGAVSIVSNTNTAQHAGSVYLAPSLQRSVSAVSTYLATEAGGITQSENEALWANVLAGDRFVLALSSNLNAGIATERLFLVDGTAVSPDQQLTTELKDLVVSRRQETLNLIGKTLWEADIYNLGGDLAVPDFATTIGKKAVNLAINAYKLTEASATPATKKSKVFSLKSAQPFTVYSASYHP